MLTSETRPLPGDLGEPVVDEQQRDVGAGVPEGRHLPVDDGLDLVVVAGEQVVEAVVAVHDPDHRRVVGGHPRGEPPVQLLGVRVLAGLGPLELLAPAAYLALEEAGRPPELAEPDLRRVHRVQCGEHVDHPAGDGARCAPDRAARAGCALRYAVPRTRSIT